MGLTASLTVSLDARGSAGTLLAQLQGPAQNLRGITLPVTPEQLQGGTRGVGQADVSGVGNAVARLAGRAAPIISSLPVAGQVLGPLGSVVDFVEQATRQDLTTRLGALRDRLAAELTHPGGTGLIGVLLRISQVLSEAEEGRLLQDLLTAFTRGSAAQFSGRLPVAEPLRALDGAVRALGGMMALETLLAEAERLAQIVSTSFDGAAVDPQVAALRALLGTGPGSLAGFVAGVAADDIAGATAAVRGVLSVASRLDAVREQVAAGLAMGEATLVYLDLDKLQAELALASTLVRSADLDPLRRQLTSLAAGLQPLASFDLAGAPARSLNQLFAEVERQIGQLAAGISALDVAQFVRPVADGIDTVTAQVRRVSDLVAQITAAFRSAMEQVRNAVAALPLGEITDAIRRLTEPIAQAIQGIRDLLARVEQALNSAAGATTTALGQIEGFLNQFQTQINNLFAGARQAVEAAHLDQAVGAVQDNIRAFSDLLAKAQMKPHFDTAVSAIGTAADVIGAVPFGLLPESMKADVDAAVKPIKETDANRVKTEIEGLLEIAPGGRFQLRGDLEGSIAGVQKKYEELLKLVKDRDPRTALADVDARLQDIARQIQQLQPSLTLEPIQRAVNQVKDAIARFHLDEQLQPVRAVFDSILQVVDQYSPARLIEPFEQRLDQARQHFLDQIKIDQWSVTLEDLRARALRLLEQVDPERLQAPLETVFTDLQTVVNRFPHLPAFGSFGTLIASLVEDTGLKISHTSFETVLGWIGGASGTAALNGRAERIALALGRTRDAVRAFDLNAASTSLTQDIAALQQAVRGLISRLPAGSPQGVELAALAPRLDGAGVFAALAANRSRYLDELDRAASLAENLRRTGFSEVDVTGRNFAGAIAPLQPMVDFLKRLLATLGVTDPQGGLAGLLRSLLAVATPARLAGMLMPLFVAFRGRIEALLNAVLNPIQAGIVEVKRLINAIDLTPVKEAMAAVVQEVKAQIQRLHPDTVLKAPLDAFKGLQDDLLHRDPLQQVITLLNNLRDAIARVLGKLRLEALLESPLAIYDQIVGKIEKLNINGLLNPVFDQLDQIAQQVDTGLTDTVTAFQRLQAALPGGGGGSAASVSAGAATG